ncbi:class I SAM-dependent methyltransferase [Actinoplanes sp. NPDC024001]|uniref:class I SAM-dependent DNA methyltransferase n=1 Tax=Actinoplanes sp. NPDC024001 TaxID=3154598 RepID=UPI0033DEE505
MAETFFDDWIARHYAVLWPELFEPAVVGAAVDFLANLAGDGAALEFGVGTGRIALPLSRRGVRVRGIEQSPAMAAQLRAQPGGGQVEVTIGDFADTAVGESFRLVYLLRNTITNLTSQDEQVRAFRNAARHLTPDGCFVIENYVPQLRRLPPGQTTHVFTRTPVHVGVEEYDVAAQIAYSHHYWVVDGELRTFSTPHRYVWPAELDLMARLAGLCLWQRWGDWNRTAFTGDSQSHISVWRMAAS